MTTRVKWFDAVRAFGLFLVLGYHLFYSLLPGGFLGVDVFFTFSGFLMTATIMAEVRKKGDFSLFTFYKRRVQRIILPMFLSIAFTLPFALLISPDFTAGISKQLASALSFTANWYNIVSGARYEAQFMPQLYMHMWSLSVLMQFYFAWGAICALLSVISKKAFKKFSNKRQTCLKYLILALSAAVAVCSYLYMQYLLNTGSSLNTIYFNSLSRLFPFFIGSTAASIWGINPKQDKDLQKRLFAKRRKQKAAALIVAVVLAIAVIVLVFAQYDFGNRFIYKYGFLSVSLITAALIYFTHALHILTPQKMREPVLLTVVSEMSYDIYLVHWPLYIIYSAVVMDNRIASILTVIMSVIFTILMLYGLERVLIPQEKRRVTKYKRTAISVVGALVICGICIGGYVIVKAPAITSIEMGFAASYVAVDVDSIVSFGRGIDILSDLSGIDNTRGAGKQASILPGTSQSGDMRETELSNSADSKLSPTLQPEDPKLSSVSEPTDAQQYAETQPSDPQQSAAAQTDVSQQTAAAQPGDTLLSAATQTAGTQQSVVTDTAGSGSGSGGSQQSQAEQTAGAQQSGATQAGDTQQNEQQRQEETNQSGQGNPSRDQPTEKSSTIETEMTPVSPENEQPNIIEGVSIIGDSVPLGARTAILDAIPNCYVNAEVNRTARQGRALMEDLQKRGELREYVVIALGTNADYDYAEQLSRFISALEPGHRLVFVTPFDGRDNTNGKLTNETAEWLRTLPSQYEYITIADWNVAVSDQVIILAGDKVHMSGAQSMQLYADVVSGAIIAASQKPAK